MRVPRDAIKKTGACLNTTMDKILISDMSLLKGGQNISQINDTMTIEEPKKKASFNLPLETKAKARGKTMVLTRQSTVTPNFLKGSPLTQLIPITEKSDMVDSSTMKHLRLTESN